MNKDVDVVFCAECKIIQPEAVGKEPQPQCSNCGAFLSDRSARCEGLFTTEDASKMWSFS